MVKCLQCNKNIIKKAHYGLHERCFNSLFAISITLDFIDFHRLRTPVPGSIDAEEDSSREAQFHGNYPKFSARLGEDLYILKFGRSDKYPLLAETEGVCNRIAKQLGLPIAEPFGSILYKGRRCFVVKNFLTARTVQNLVHIWDLWPKKDGAANPYLLETMIDLLERHVSASEVERVVQLLLYDYLIGNDDRHRGNIAIIESADGTKKLAPFYDNVSALGIEEPGFLDSDMKWHPATRVQLASGEVDFFYYVSCIREVGYGDAVIGFQNKLRHTLEDILQILKSSQLHPNLMGCFSDLIHRRSQEILNWT